MMGYSDEPKACVVAAVRELYLKCHARPAAKIDTSGSNQAYGK